MSSNLKTIKTESFSKALSSQIFWIITFSFLTIVSAQIAVPVQPVPFTLQTMMVLLSGALLGSRNGAYSQLLYLFFGSIGLPVFANGAFGAAHLFGPTGGYLLAFPIGAFLTGYLIESFSVGRNSEKRNYLKVVVSMFVGNISIILIGVLFLHLFFVKNLTEAIKVGAALFSVWMVIKVFAAAAVYFGISKKYSKLPG